jgi:hypothetical protein
LRSDDFSPHACKRPSNKSTTGITCCWVHCKYLQPLSYALAAMQGAAKCVCKLLLLLLLCRLE